MEKITTALLAYDVACQWFIHFNRRVEQSKTLTLDDLLEVIVAVGKFHLSAHIRDCFVKFTLNFIKGVGQLDGEIMETLWAEFNKVSKNARSMTKAHRREVYDDHMRDSNWKKLVGMSMSSVRYLPPNCFNIFSVPSLSKKFIRDVKEREKAEEAFSALTESLPKASVALWTSQAAEAMIERGDHMKIYDVDIAKGE